MEELFLSLSIHAKMLPRKSLTSSAQKEVLCSLVHCILANWHIHLSKLVSHSFSPKCMDSGFFFIKMENGLSFGYSQNYFTYSSIKILVQCYQVWRMSLETYGTCWKTSYQRDFNLLTESKEGILGLSFIFLCSRSQGGNRQMAASEAVC